LKTLYPKIKSAQLRRYGITTLKLTVVERVPSARWCDEHVHQTCYSVDEAGLIYEVVGDAVDTKDDLIITGGNAMEEISPIGTYIQKDRFYKISAFTAMAQRLGHPTIRTHIFEDGIDMSLITAGPSFRVLIDDPVETVERILKTALESPTLKDRIAELAYIDARFGNRLYYSFTNTAVSVPAVPSTPVASPQH
jgi:hypothetical protein